MPVGHRAFSYFRSIVRRFPPSTSMHKDFTHPYSMSAIRNQLVYWITFEMAV